MKFLSLLGQAANEYYADPYMYDTSTYDTAANNAQISDAAAIGVFLFVLIFIVITAIVSYVIMAFLMSRIFKKAGIEQWKAWVPVYNTWIFLELGGQKGFWAVLALIPPISLVSIVFYFIAAYHIGLKLGKEGWFVLLAIFIPLVWFIWLGFDKSTWNGQPAPATPNGAPIPPATPAPSSPTPPPVAPPKDTTPPKPTDTPPKAE